MARRKKITIVLGDGDASDAQVLGEIRRKLLNARLIDEAKKFDAEATGKTYKDVIKIAKKYANIEFPVSETAEETVSAETEEVASE